jgi:hypothetical protein
VSRALGFSIGETRIRAMLHDGNRCQKSPYGVTERALA